MIKTTRLGHAAHGMGGHLHAECLSEYITVHPLVLYIGFPRAYRPMIEPHRRAGQFNNSSKRSVSVDTQIKKQKEKIEEEKGRKKNNITYLEGDFLSVPILCPNIIWRPA